MQKANNNKQPIEENKENSYRKDPYFERIAEAVANQPYNSAASPPPVLSYLTASDGAETRPGEALIEKPARKNWLSRILGRHKKPSPVLALTVDKKTALESRLNHALEDFLLETQEYRTEAESISVLHNVVQAVVRASLARELRAGRLIISDTLEKSRKS